MDPFAQVRARCLGMDGVTERLSHGSPSFFARGTRGRCFCMCMDDHHGDGRLALWLAAPEGEQDALISQDPETFFTPPYVGTRGWVGVRLDRGLDQTVVDELLEEALRVVEPSRRSSPT
jgi:hypothetical protein